MILTKLFVILLTILLILEMIKYFKNKLNPVREGATTMSMGAGAGTSPSASEGDAGQYTDPGLGKDPIYLSKLNASNITFLKDKVDELVGLKQQLTDLSARVYQD